ncbi:MAG: MBL fold metallo-hydrolase, partial [Candidatus Omnitrophica bacterium]|nr:MBL fold metallo-hydrolase [Candidatus Omnitrophota bacterium]
MPVPDDMILKQIPLGPMDNFLYFIGDKQTNEIAVVDPAWDVDYLCAAAEKNGYYIKSIFLTHAHHDHVNGLKEILSRHDVPVYISKYEADFYRPKHKNLVDVDNGQMLKIGNVEFQCIHTPGHSPGCQCFKHGDVLIAGDLIFVDGCGRCDLPGGDAGVMYHSLFDILLKMPDSTIVYPGHNYGAVPFATLGELKKHNPY